MGTIRDVYRATHSDEKDVGEHVDRTRAPYRQVSSSTTRVMNTVQDSSLRYDSSNATRKALEWNSSADEDYVPQHVSKPKRLWFTVGWIVQVIVVCALIYGVFGFYLVPSASMSPTLEAGQRFVGVRSWVTGYNVKRGDIVVFKDSLGWLSSGENGYLVKRVIGVGGDRIVSDGTNLYVNNVRQHELYLKDSSNPVSGLKFDITVPQGKLWVMGDNRAHSADSRYHSDTPYISVADVQAVLFACIYPLHDIGFVH